MKFELTDETVEISDVTYHRIRALENFSNVKTGDLGGWVEKIENLDMTGDAWVYGNALVTGNARVSGDAWVSGG